MGIKMQQSKGSVHQGSIQDLAISKYSCHSLKSDKETYTVQSKNQCGNAAAKSRTQRCVIDRSNLERDTV